MANDFSQRNILAYHLVYKCQMAIAGRNLATKMGKTALCTQDKINFVLAMIYLKTMLKRYNDNSCITDDQICTMSNFIKKYLGSSHFATRGCGCS